MELGRSCGEQSLTSRCDKAAKDFSGHAWNGTKMPFKCMRNLVVRISLEKKNGTSSAWTETPWKSFVALDQTGLMAVTYV